MTPKETSTPSALQGRQMPIPVHMSAASPHHYGGYESPLTGRSGGMARGVFSTRYPVAPPPSPIYSFENDMCRLVSFQILTSVLAALEQVCNVFFLTFPISWCERDG